MKIYVTNRQKCLKIFLKQVRHLAKGFLNWKKVKCHEVSIHFIDKESITQLHEKYFKDPTPTDCISFPIDSPQKEQQGYSILGEIFVCPQVAMEYVKKKGGNVYWEVSLYIVHGLLHLLGYDDQEPKNRSLMFAEQQVAMLYLEKNRSLLHK